MDEVFHGMLQLFEALPAVILLQWILAGQEESISYIMGGEEGCYIIGSDAWDVGLQKAEEIDPWKGGKRSGGEGRMRTVISHWWRGFPSAGRRLEGHRMELEVQGGATAVANDYGLHLHEVSPEHLHTLG